MFPVRSEGSKTLDFIDFFHLLYENVTNLLDLRKQMLRNEAACNPILRPSIMERTIEL